MLVRIVYYFLLPGKHSDSYYLRLNALKDISQYLSLAYIVYLSNYSCNKYNYFIIKWFYRYCKSFAIIMLYVFLPGNISCDFKGLMFSFNLLWGILVVGLIGYYLFFNRDKLA